MNSNRSKIGLDVYELTFLYRNIELALKKKEKELNNHRKKLREHAGYQTGLGIKKKMTGLKDAAVLSFNPKEARLMSHLIPPMTDLLLTSTIPTYEKKIHDQPEMKEHLEKYLDGARKLVVKLNKLKERLDDAS